MRYAWSMVRRDATEALSPQGGRSAEARCVSPTGERPVPVSIGAPGSRSQTSKGDLRVRAGRQKPVRRRERSSGEQARGPQHEVKPAASTEEQSGSRATHVMAKATSVARAPKLDADPGGVEGAARVQGEARNTRGPSARPKSGQSGSYKPKAKTVAVQRESEGIVVPMMVAQNNATGGKGPCGDSAERAGKREGMAGTTGPNDPGGRRPRDKVRELQRQLCGAAKRAPGKALPRAVRSHLEA